MAHNDPPVLTGVIVEEYSALGVDDLGRLCTVESRRIVELVEEGVLQADHDERGGWHFSGASLRRAKIALRLQEDLGINLAGVALALELMDEIERLRRDFAHGR
jgi:chaperone modulatory protein CbpM